MRKSFKKWGNKVTTVSRGARPRLRLWGLVAMMLLAAAPVVAQQHVGYVLDVAGDWYVEGGTPQALTPGERLPAGGRVFVKSPGQYDYIIIARRDGGIMERRDCSNSGECQRPIRLPGSVSAKGSVVGILFDLVMGRIWGSERRYPGGGVRGEDLQEAVLELEGERFDLAPALRAAPDKSSCVRVRPVPRAGDEWTQNWLGPSDIKGTSVQMPGLKPGVYEIEMLRKMQGKCWGVGSSAWVLFARPFEYAEAKSRFVGAMAITANWGDEARPGPEVRRRFLQAFLDPAPAGAK